MEMQKSGASWDTGGTELEGVGTEKPETRLGCRKELSSQAGATQQEQQPAVTKRYALFYFGKFYIIIIMYVISRC